MADTLFADQADVSPEVTQVDPEKDYFVELVGEDKKYKDVKAAGRALVEKDNFIEQLKAERRKDEEEKTQLRQELAARTTLQSVVDKIESLRTTEPPVAGNQSDERPDPNKEISGVEVEKAVERVLDTRTRAERADANLRHVKDVLKRNFGPGYAEVLRQKGEEAGIGEKFLDSLAREAPKALFTLVGAKETTPESARNPAVSTLAAPGIGTGRKNYKYYQDLRKKDPVRANSAVIQNEMVRQLADQGDDFYK